MSFTLLDYQLKELIPHHVTKDDYIDWGLKVVGAEIAWAKTKGEGIRVAILDTGVDPDHEDLKDNIVETIDFTGSPYGVEDKQGHGTHVAGIIGASNNEYGMVGVAPEVDLYIAKVLSDDGSGKFKDIMKGIEWAIEKEVHVVCMSLGSASRPPEKMRTLIRKAVEAGIVIVAATGNENSNVCYPAAYDEVIAVSAINQDLEKADFSNYGMKNCISAPGVDIISTYKDGGYAKLSGTSMATPLVAGAVALIIARYKEIFFELKPSVSKTHQILERMVEDLGEEGRDDFYGAGMLNLAMLP